MGVTGDVIMETRSARGTWLQIGAVASQTDGEAGSISDYTDDRREVIVFGWVEGEGPCVWRSSSGVDFENPKHRLVVSAGLDLLARLEEGHYERTITSALGHVATIRLRVEE